MDAHAYCRDKVAVSGSSFALSFLFLPQAQRDAITAVYAFCREVDDVVDDCSEPEVARATLQWWREEIAAMYAGAPQHPVTRALAPFTERFALPEEHFREIIDGMEMDLDRSGYDDFSQLALYCYRVAGVVGLISAEIFGYEDRRTLKYALTLGTALQLTNILRDVDEDLGRGRIYLPRDEMARFGVSAEDLAARSMSTRLRALFAAQARRAAEHFQQAMDLLPEVDRHRQRSGLIMAAVYAAQLKMIGERDYDVLSRRVSLSPWRKVWIAWGTARAEQRRYQRYRGAAEHRSSATSGP